LIFAADLELARGYSTQRLGLFEQVKAKDPSQFYLSNWNLELWAAQSRFFDSVTSERIVSRTRGLSGGVGFTAFEDLNLDLGIQAQNAADSSYSESGGFLGLSKDWETWTVGFEAGTNKIKQKLTLSTIEREVELQQKQATVFVKILATEDLDFRISGTGYTYNKTKDELQLVYRNRLSPDGNPEFAGTIGGLPESSVGLHVNYALTELVGLSLASSSSRLLVDQSISKHFLIQAKRDFGTWGGSFGLASAGTDGNTESSLLLGFETDM
jgi:hypothetical protein